MQYVFVVEEHDTNVDMIAIISGYMLPLTLRVRHGEMFLYCKQAKNVFLGDAQSS